ncbi:MAG: ATP-binding cassette domain-containing protein [Thermomicrobiales bacterium]
MIEVLEVSKRYGETTVVDDVTLTIRKGGITSIIGPNGAGKSSLLGMISRLSPMDAGKVTVDGLDVSTTPSDQLARRLSILRQDNHIPVRLTVEELVAFGRYPYTKGRPNRQDKEHIDAAIEYLNLNEFRTRFLDQLSGGQRQRAFVAMVLCQDTDYVLLDEPLNSLDMKHSVDMMQLLRKTADELNKTIVLVLHDINFASVYSDEIIAMKEGKVVLQAPPRLLMCRHWLQEIYEIDVHVEHIAGHNIGVYYRQGIIEAAAAAGRIAVPHNPMSAD